MPKTTPVQHQTKLVAKEIHSTQLHKLIALTSKNFGQKIFGIRLCPIVFLPETFRSLTFKDTIFKNYFYFKFFIQGKATEV